MADILKRSLAPITDAAWNEIDTQAATILRGNLSARQLVDFEGPLGWESGAVNLGRVDAKKSQPVQGVSWGMRRVQPLVEIRVPFTLDIWELDDVSGGHRRRNLMRSMMPQRRRLFSRNKPFTAAVTRHVSKGLRLTVL